MAVWRWLIDSAGVVLLLALLYGLLLIVRRRWLSRSGGTFELSVRTRPTDNGRGWVLGVGRYEADALEWFRVFSLWPRAKRRYRRGEISYRSQRTPTPMSTSAWSSRKLVSKPRNLVFHPRNPTPRVAM